MAGTGRISLLVDSPLRTVALAIRGLEPEMRKQINAHTKRLVNPVWKETTREHAQTRLQARVLAGTARAGVSSTTVTLNAGGMGRLSSGTPTGDLSRAAEHGAKASTLVTVRSRKGKTFKRRMGNRFGGPRRGGYVVYPAARESIPRIASLVVQTAIRTVHEEIEKVSNG